MKNCFKFILSMRWAAITFLIGLLASCNNTAAPLPSWNQFHGDGANQGFISITTPEVLKTKWQADLGAMISYSSPSCDTSGNIYITLSTFVVKVNSAGVIQWKKDFQPAMVTTTPAIADDGRIYIVANTKFSNENYRSELHCLDAASGALLWSRNFGGNIPTPIFGAPKVWDNGDHSAIFVYGHGKIYAFSSDGRMVGFDEQHHCTVIHGTSWLWDIFKTIWDALMAIKRENMSFNVSSLEWYWNLGWPDQTPAVVNYRGSPFTDKPLIVVGDECGMAGIQWDPDLEDFSQLWAYNLGDAGRLATPTITAVGTMVTIQKKDEKGIVQYFDIFSDIHRPVKITEYTIQDEVPGTPAAAWLGSYFFIASRHKLWRFDSIGNLVTSVQLKGETFAPPSCSLSYIYVSTTSGLEYFDVELSQSFLFPTAPYGCGVTAPAIDRSKTVYIVDQMGFLYAL